MEKTLCIIKPDAVAKGVENQINDMLKAKGLTIIESKKMKLTEDMAKEFYAEHAERPFYADLVSFMTSGDVIVQVLEGENAIKAYREVMGATNPNNAEPGTIRYEFARGNEDLSANAVHGSDSPESASREIGFFFGEACGCGNNSCAA